MADILGPRELAAILTDPDAAEALSVASNGTGYLVVDLDAGNLPGGPLLQPACTIIGLTRVRGATIPAVVDVVAEHGARLDQLTGAIAANPVAASVLVRLLRHNANVDVHAGLFAESLAYSTLQHGREFAAWRAQQPAAPIDTGQETNTPEEPVRLTRVGNTLAIELDRPARRNAYSAAMRDALCNALMLALQDHHVHRVRLSGAGPAFCAGGDLTEFGLARDAALAHASRMTRSAAALLHALGERVECLVHGACIGAGIELPAFTRRIHARPDAFFRLPEVGMGLVPGAGGTVSITKRIGRLLTARMALTGESIGVDEALRWGLVDAIEPAAGRTA